jgi:hypothetical protein
MSQELDTLLDMLSYKRPAGSVSEQEFREKFILPTGVWEDGFGNLIHQIGDDPVVLWSSHTDSVHRSDGKQEVVYDGSLIRLAKKSNSSCLGADDAAGVWIMLEMIKANVPGLYIFHYGEERGGIGSNAIARETPDILDGIQSAIAFDRRGTTSVITHQGGRTCSDAFGQSLADQLPGYKIDPNGIYTDTRNYKHLVPECTNLSVGYTSEHTSYETLDVDHLIRLRNMMVTIDADSLIIERDPTELDVPAKSFSSIRSWSRSSMGIEDVVSLYPQDVTNVLLDAGVDADAFVQLVYAERDRRWEERSLGSRSVA